jgi:putative intracellular protease/amidase
MSVRDANPVNPKGPRRVAIVIANPAVSTTTGWPTGFWWSELSHPYLAFTEVGYEVEVFSPKGGACEADAMSDPRSLLDEMKKLGANYIQAGLWRDFAVRDGNLITGQQNFSGRATAQAVIAALGE